jgi:Zn finger protein HypA/HybF involved in hydrogenase expression
VDVTQLEDARMTQASGYYWCLKCRRQTELLDSDVGLAGKRCEHCHSEKIEWRVGTPELPHWAVDLPEGKPKQTLHRLAPEQRDLRRLAEQGYHFCNGCQNVTEKDKRDRCILCKSDQVEWHDPVFKEEEP